MVQGQVFQYANGASLLEIPVIQWPFTDGNRVQVWATTTPDYKERMRIIASATKITYTKLCLKDKQ